MKQERSLAHPRPRDQSEKAAVGFDSVEQRCERLTMRRRQVEIARVWRDAEWLLAKSEEFFKHRPLSPDVQTGFRSLPSKADSHPHDRIHCHRQSRPRFLRDAVLPPEPGFQVRP